MIEHMIDAPVLHIDRYVVRQPLNTVQMIHLNNQTFVGRDASQPDKAILESFIIRIIEGYCIHIEIINSSEKEAAFGLQILASLYKDGVSLYGNGEHEAYGRYLTFIESGVSIGFTHDGKEFLVVL